MICFFQEKKTFDPAKGDRVPQSFNWSDIEIKNYNPELIIKYNHFHIEIFVL